MGIRCGIFRELKDLNYLLAGEVEAWETWIYLCGVSVCGVYVMHEDIATSAKINQENIILNAAALASQLLASLTNNPGKLRFS